MNQISITNSDRWAYITQIFGKQNKKFLSSYIIQLFYTRKRNTNFTNTPCRLFVSRYVICTLGSNASYWSYKMCSNHRELLFNTKPSEKKKSFFQLYYLPLQCELTMCGSCIGTLLLSSLLNVFHFIFRSFGCVFFFLSLSLFV